MYRKSGINKNLMWSKRASKHAWWQDRDDHRVYISLIWLTYRQIHIFLKICCLRQIRWWIRGLLI